MWLPIQIHEHRVFSFRETFKVHGRNVLISWGYFSPLKTEKKNIVFRAFPTIIIDAQQGII